MASTLIPSELFTLESFVTPTAQGIASRVLARTAVGNITLFSFDAGEELSEHTGPFDALALTLSGALVLTIGGPEVLTACWPHRRQASSCPVQPPAEAAGEVRSKSRHSTLRRQRLR
jgi:hypothetical protein